MNDEFNPQQPPNAGPLDQGEKYSPDQRQGPIDNCEEILRLIYRNGGLPVTINPVHLTSGHPEDEFREIRGISRFIKESRIPFNKYKELMDEILNCRPGLVETNKKILSGGCEEKQEQQQAPHLKHLLTPEDNLLFRQGALFSSSK